MKKIHKTTLAAALLASLTSVAYAEVTREEFQKLDEDVQELVDNIYGDQEDSLVRVVEKNQERVGTLGSAQQATTAVLTNLAPKVEDNEKKIAELDADINEVVESTGEAVKALDEKQAETAAKTDVLSEG
ncbi:hypothetical protein ACWIYZ_09285, partial [Ursidibacter arcticus]